MTLDQSKKIQRIVEAIVNKKLNEASDNSFDVWVVYKRSTNPSGLIEVARYENGDDAKMIVRCLNKYPNIRNETFTMKLETNYR